MSPVKEAVVIFSLHVFYIVNHGVEVILIAMKTLLFNNAKDFAAIVLSAIT